MKNKAVDFDKTVKEIIYPAFPLIADEFLKKSNIKEGLCLDIGAGNGYLGLALAEKSDLQVRLIDIDPEILEFAETNIKARNLADQVKTIRADVEALPYPNNSVQLIVSRGSIFFWENQAKGLDEIYRILAPGGVTFIGGGFGTPEIFDEIGEKMKIQDPTWERHLAERIGPDSPKRFQKVLEKTCIPKEDVEISYNRENLWIIIKK